MSDQRLVVGGLVAVVMFLVGGVVVLGVQGWIHRPVAPVTSSSSPPEVARVAATAPSVDPVVTSVTSAPVIVATTVATTTTTTGATAVAPSVAGDATTGALVTSAPIANAEARIASLRPGFRRCYNAGLASDPKMTGNVVLAIKIDPAGKVEHVDKVGGTGLSSTVESCMIDRAMSPTFDPPGGTGATIRVPVTFMSSPAATNKGAFNPLSLGR